MSTTNGQHPGYDARALDVFTHHQTGVRLEALVQFSEPFLALYDLHPDHVYHVIEASEDPEEVECIHSVLTTTRLIWAYFSLPASKQESSLAVLTAACIGIQADQEEEEAFLELLALMREQWYRLSRKERETAVQATAFPTLSFSELLTQAAAADPSIALSQSLLPPIEVWGPDHLGLPDAMALFSSPMLDDLDPLDLEALDQTMNRAYDYWELAQQYGSPDFEVTLNTLTHRYGRSPASRQRIETEAKRMVRRYFELFPEQRPA